MKLKVEFGGAQEDRDTGVWVVGPDIPGRVVIYASSLGWTSANLGTRCIVTLDPKDAGHHFLRASVRDAQGIRSGSEAREEFEWTAGDPPFIYCFFHVPLRVRPGELFVHTSLDDLVFQTREILVLPHEENPRRTLPRKEDPRRPKS